MAEMTQEEQDAHLRTVVAGAVATALGQQTFTKADAERLVNAAAEKAVIEYNAKMFAQLGFDMANMKDINRLRGNLDFLNSLHSGASRVGGWAMLAVITTLVGAFLLAFWEGVKAFATLKGVPVR